MSDLALAARCMGPTGGAEVRPTTSASEGTGSEAVMASDGSELPQDGKTPLMPSQPHEKPISESIAECRLAYNLHRSPGFHCRRLGGRSVCGACVGDLLGTPVSGGGSGQASSDIHSRPAAPSPGNQFSKMLATQVLEDGSGQSWYDIHWRIAAPSPGNLFTKMLETPVSGDGSGQARSDTHELDAAPSPGNPFTKMLETTVSGGGSGLFTDDIHYACAAPSPGNRFT